MAEHCEQCAALELQLSEIKAAIAEEIRKGHRHRSDIPELGVRSLATLLDLLAQTESVYSSHKKIFHEGEA